ncbi:MAG: S-layer homology domain-containing protein [SAR324 cluster bacterium]|nr:S-layer homology domain-containing protein [SAR324 cluster bacterium]
MKWAMEGAEIPLMDSSTTPYFSDVSQTSPYFPYVQTAKERGMVDGYESGREFGLESSLLRQDAAKLLLNVFGVGNLSECTTPAYSDVPKDSWACKYIRKLKEMKILQGVFVSSTSSQFNPRGTLDFKTASKMISVMMAYKISPEAPFHVILDSLEDRQTSSPFPAVSLGELYEPDIFSTSGSLSLSFSAPEATTAIPGEKAVTISAVTNCSDCAFYWEATGGKLSSTVNGRLDTVTWVAPKVTSKQTLYIYGFAVNQRRSGIAILPIEVNAPSSPPGTVIPPSVSISAPASNTSVLVNTSAEINFLVTQGTNPVRVMKVEVSTDGGITFTTVPKTICPWNINTLVACSWTFPDSSDNAMLRIRAYDSQGKWGESSVNFRVVNSPALSCAAPPEIPHLSDPGAFTEQNSITLSWLTTPGARTYTLLESRTPDFINATSYGVNGTSYTLSDKSNGWYYYQLVVENDCGSQRSAWVDMEVKVNRVPFEPSSPYPANGAVTVSRTPTLQWEGGDPDGGFVDYYVELGTEPQTLYTKQGYGTNNAGNTQLELRALEPGKTYYWRVKAKDSTNLVTVGPLWSFTTTSSEVPDLRISDFNITGTVKNGVPVTATITVINQGTFASDTSDLRFFYSTVSGAEQNEIPYALTTVSWLKPGESQTLTRTITIQNLVSGTSYITAKIDNYGRFAESDLSNNKSDYTINYMDSTPPSITVFELRYSNAQGQYKSNTSYQFVYSVFDDISVKGVSFSYSTDNGANWINILKDQPVTNGGNGNSFFWTIPSNVPLNNTFKVKIAAQDASNSTSEKILGPFSIINGTPPVVAITSPKADDAWKLGETKNITWSINSANSIRSVEIWYSNGKNSSSKVIQLNSNPGTYSWMIPNNSSYASDTAQFKLYVDDSNFNRTELKSDLFRVIDASSVARPWGGLPTRITTVPSVNTSYTSQDHSQPVIAMDSAGNLHAAYLYLKSIVLPSRTVTWILYYTKKTGTVWSTPTVIKTMQTTDADSWIGTPKIAVDSNNNPHLVWVEGRPSASEIYYTSLNGGSWKSPFNFSDLPGSSESWQPSILIDKKNTVHFTWIDRPGRKISYRKFNLSTNSWSTTESVTDGDMSYSLAVDHQNTLHLVYPFNTTNTLQHRYRAFSDTKWSDPKIIKSLTDVSLNSTSLISDAQNKLHLAISQYTPNQRTYHLAYFSDINGAWSEETIVIKDAQIHYEYPVIQVSSLHLPQIIAKSQDRLVYLHQTAQQNWLLGAAPHTLAQILGGDYPFAVATNNTSNFLHVVYAANYSSHGEIFHNSADLSLDIEAPEVSMTTPTLGANLKGGSTTNVTWIATDNKGISKLTLHYSTDDGKTLVLIQDNIANTGSFSWTIPDLTSSTMKLYLTASDAAGNVTSANTESFTVESFLPQTITLNTSATLQTPLALNDGNTMEVNAGVNLQEGLSLKGNATLKVAEGKVLRIGKALTIPANTTVTISGQGQVEFADPLTLQGTLNVGGYVVFQSPPALAATGTIITGAFDRKVEFPPNTVLKAGTLNVKNGTLILNGDLNTSGATFLTGPATRLILKQDTILTSEQAVSSGLELNNHILNLGSATTDLTVTSPLVLDDPNERILYHDADLTLGPLTMTHGLIQGETGTLTLKQGGNVSGGVVWSGGGHVILSSSNLTTFSDDCTLALYNSSLQSDTEGQLAQLIVSGSPNLSMTNGTIAYIQVNGGNISTFGTTILAGVTNVESSMGGFKIVKPNENVWESGSWSTFPISLTARPQGKVVLQLAGSDDSEAKVNPAQMIFTPDNWNAPQWVTVMGVDDDEADHDQTFQVMLFLAGTEDPRFKDEDLEDVSLLNLDDDIAGIVTSSISGKVTEGGQTATVMVRLNSQPRGNVVVNLSSSNLNEGVVSPDSLTFTNTNWHGLQVVTVRGVNDNVKDGDRNFTINLSTVSGDDQYNGLGVTPVPVVNLDDDQAGFWVGSVQGSPTEEGDSATFTVSLISEPTADVTLNLSNSDLTEATVSPATLIFTTQNWDGLQTVTVTGVADSIVDGNQPVTVVLSAAESTDTNYNGLNPDNLIMYNTDHDSAGILVGDVSGDPSENGATATFSVRLSSQPEANVTLPISSDNPSEIKVSPASLIFTPQNWNATQTVTLNGVDDPDIDGNQQVFIRLNPATSTDSHYQGLDASDVEVANLDNDSAGVWLSGISGQPSEAGGVASFQVRLQSRPAQNLTIPLSNSRSDEVTVSPPSLTFTPANWNGLQTVTLTGRDDYVADGNQEVKIHLTVNSSESVWQSLSIPDVTVLNQDNDAPGLEISAVSGQVTETGGQAGFTVKLRSQPSASVTLNLSSSDVTEATVSPIQIVFTPQNWNAVQTVTVTGVDDSEQDGNQPFKVVLAALVSSDAGYQGMDPADVAVINHDNETAGIEVSSVTGIPDETGKTASFMVKLNTQPVANVILPLSSLNAKEILVSPSSLTFTSANWNGLQTVTLTGVDDAIEDGNQPVSIELGAAISSDPQYQGMDVPDVNVVNEDNDIAGFLVTSPTGNVDESGKSVKVKIHLRTQPVAPVALTVQSSNVLEGIVLPAELNFTEDNWNADQEVVVTGVADVIKDGHQEFLVKFLPSRSADPNYDGTQLKAIPLLNEDLNDARLLVSAVTGTANEDGGSATFTVSLSSQPTAPVNLKLQSSKAGEIRISPTALVLTPANWNAPQTITLTGVDDEAQDGHQAVTVQFLSVISNDPNYQGKLPEQTVTVINEDRDTGGFIISPVSGNIREDGRKTYFEVRLTTRPMAEVRVEVSSSDETEGTVLPQTLIFTSQDWNSAHEVWITPVDDDTQDGNQPLRVELSPASSGDPLYDQLNPDDVELLNEDDDTAGIVVSAISGPAHERGGVAKFTVRLMTRPESEVTLPVASSDTTECVVSPAKLVFTPENWKGLQTVEVTGKPDQIKDGNQRVKVSLGTSQSSDPLYHDLVSTPVEVVNEDRDVASLLVSKTQGVTTEQGQKAWFTVSLSSRPKATVNLNVSSSNPQEGQVTPETLQMTPENWNREQTLAVTGVDDARQDGNQKYQVTLKITDSTDPDYSGLEPKILELINEDDDKAGMVMSPSSGNTSESGLEARFSLQLKTQPAFSVSLRVKSSDETEGVVIPDQITMTPDNWKTPQVVTVRGVNDTDVDGDQEYQILIDPAVSADKVYQGMKPNGILKIINKDDDVPVVTATPANGATTNGTTSTQEPVKGNAGTSIQKPDTATVTVNALGEQVVELIPPTRPGMEITKIQTVMDKLGNTTSIIETGTMATSIQAPPGSKTEMSDKGTLQVVTEDKPTPKGNTASMTASTNSRGEVEVSLMVTKGGVAEEVILPKTQPGSTVQMDYAQGTITIVTPLNPNYLQVGKRNRQGRVQAEVYYFAGREPDGLKPVNIVPKADNVSMTMVRGMDTNEAQIDISGLVEVWIGEAQVNARQITVQNITQRIQLEAGTNLIALPANLTMDWDELESKFKNVHSVWWYRASTKDWAFYTTNMTNYEYFKTQWERPLMEDTVFPGEALWVQVDEAQSLNFRDNGDFELIETVSGMGDGWHFVGNSNALNDNGQSIVAATTIKDLFKTNSGITALWTRNGERWGVFSTNERLKGSDLASQQIEWLEEDIALPPGNGFWLCVGTCGANPVQRLMSQPTQ